MNSYDQNFKEAFTKIQSADEEFTRTIGTHTDEELQAYIKNQHSAIEQYLDAAKFEDQELGALAQALDVSLKAALEVKQAIIDGRTMNAADLTVTSTLNDVKREIADRIANK